jgi:hypothetical protein
MNTFKVVILGVGKRSWKDLNVRSKQTTVATVSMLQRLTTATPLFLVFIMTACCVGNHAQSFTLSNELCYSPS